jgi:hypothetical protein
MSADILRERGHPVSVEALQEAWRHGGQHFVNAADDGLIDKSIPLDEMARAISEVV